MNRKLGAQATGIVLPLMKKGDDLINTVVDCVLALFKEEHWYWEHEELCEPYVTYEGLNDKDIIGITESIVARAAGLYITVDDIARETEKFFGKNSEIWMTNAIYSRNRHSLILRGIARACKKINFVANKEDSRGNLWGVNPFTGVSIPEYYKQICEEENCNFVVCDSLEGKVKKKNIINCELHTVSHHDPSNFLFPNLYYLTDFCRDKNPDFGLLGSNKANDENGGTLKLFPTRELAAKVCNEVKTKIKEKTGKDVYVMVYGDGHFHSPYIYDEDGNEIPGTSINEFADPVAFLSGVDTQVFNDTPNEFKLKYFIDSGVPEEKIREQMEDTVMKNTSNLGQMSAQGCTPRRYGDLLASLMDLTSGSGNRATPVVLVKNYF